MIHVSHFNVPFSLGTLPAMWNSRSGCRVILSPSDAKALTEGRPWDLDPHSREYLLSRGFLTEDDEEVAHFLAERHAARQLRSPHFRIFTTTGCNARCDYCYERNFPLMTMDESTSKATAAFIAKTYRAHPLGRPVLLEWFGGEPTLNPAAIHTVTEQLARNGIPFRSSMITNGLLLTEQLLQNAARWNLRHVQLTLDGTAEVFERSKGFPSGSFDRVLHNMNRCMDLGIDVSLRIHYAGSTEPVRDLIGLLSRQPRRPKVYIAPLYQSETAISADCMEAVMALNEEMIRVGLMTVPEVYDLSQLDRCFCATPWGYTVLPDGTLVNCSHNISPANSLGSVRDPHPETPLHQKFLSPIPEAECMDCPLLPVCGGGCSAAQHRIADMHRCIPYRRVITRVLSRLAL